MTQRLDTLDLPSPQLGNTRQATVLVPREGRGPFPVLLMHDGHNLHDPALSSFGSVWNVGAAAGRLEREGFPCVIVGLAATPARLSEYAPFPSRHNGGRARAADYLDFLTGTVLPWVRDLYPVRTDPEGTGLLGSSMGGLVSLYAAAARPDVFGFAGAMSPSLWFARGAMFRWLESRLPSTFRSYVDIGTEEGADPAERRRHVRDAARLAGLLAGAGMDVLLRVDPGARHHEAAWAARFPTALRHFLEGAG
ncbi:MAG TPA: alpha/beta hydrolase-fold protein [Deinococcales bacterium]|nr:alpha/beta hydrolase-fold protein [Deinococcales bacterium]